MSSDSSSTTSLNSSVFVESNNTEDTNSIDEADTEYDNETVKSVYSSSQLDLPSEFDKS